MQFCMPHWEALKAAIRDRGLWPFVATSGEEAASQAVAELEGTADPRTFDPLASATWAIYGQFTKNIGLAAMVGDLCPLCEVEKSAPGRADNWIIGCCDEMLAGAREVGMVPSVQ